MYRLLIVDDEIEVLEYFQRIFTKSDIPVEIYTANSAQEALYCLEQLRIDIILSDIKMPKMNGIQMYDVVKTKWPRCKVIFLSGVLEFDYIYQLIQNKDVRYLTKLESVEKIIKTVKEVIGEIEDEHKAQFEQQNLNEVIHQAIPLLQNKFLNRLINNIADENEVNQERLNELKIPLNIASPVTVVSAIFDYIKDELRSDIELKIYSLKAIANKIFDENFNSVCYVSEQMVLVWFLQPKEDCLEKFNNNQDVIINASLEYIQSACKESLGLTITFAYSNEKSYLDNLKDQLINLKRAMSYKSGCVKEGIIISRGVMQQDEILWEDDEVVNSCKQLVRLNMLEGYLELGQGEEFFDLFNSIVSPLLNIRSKNYGPALVIYYSISTMLMKYVSMWHLTEKLAFKIEMYKLMRADEHGSWKEAVEYLSLLTKQIFDIQFTNQTKMSADAIVLIQKYIQENLEKDLSLITLAQIVNLNPSYLSWLFKSETNKNLYEYIVEIRMAKAKDMLENTNVKVQDIAVSVGYESAQSFTRVFKKCTSSSPSEYRETAKSKLLVSIIEI